MEQNTKHAGHFKKWHHLMLYFEDLNQKKTGTSVAPESLWPISATVVTTLGFEAWKGQLFTTSIGNFLRYCRSHSPWFFSLPWISPNLWRNTKKRKMGETKLLQVQRLFCFFNILGGAKESSSKKTKTDPCKVHKGLGQRHVLILLEAPQNHVQFGGGPIFEVSVQ